MSSARTRLLVSILVGIVALVAGLLLTPWQVGALLGWDAAAATYIASVWWTVRGLDAGGTESYATREDNSRVAAEAILIAASLASLIGVGAALLRASSEQGSAHSAITGVAVLTVVLSWAAVHTVFTLRYARLYYTHGGGIDWHNHEKPDYGDFAYVALTLGMTYQVSDTDLTGKAIRMTAVRHGLLSYLLGVVVVAMTINVVASLLAK